MLKKLRQSTWTFLRRRQLRTRIRRQRGPLRLIVGAGGTQQEGWIASEADSLNLVDEQDWAAYFQPDSIDAILAEHVWEHLDKEQGARAAHLCYRYLKPGGYLRLAVPDGHHPNPDYIAYVEVGGRGPGASDHKVLYDHQSLTAMLKGVGFEVELLEYFDKQGSFHAQDWDSLDGHVERSLVHDSRNSNRQPNYTSLIVDAHKAP